MASKITQLNHERATQDPGSQFDSPRALAEVVGLTRGEKISALEGQAQLVDRRLASGYEGMPIYDIEPRDAELLREIELQKAKLEGEARTA